MIRRSLCDCGCGTSLIPFGRGERRYLRFRGRCGVFAPGHPVKPTREQIFWSRVTKTDGCWLWDKPHGFGYGRLRWNGGRSRSAHVVSWEMANGPVPPGLYVCHKCDTPPCVRPDHLFLGTAGDNVRDCSAKGRISRGEHRPHHKITASDVMTIRGLKASGRSSYLLARQFGISRPMVMAIVHRRRWKHVA